MIRIVAAGAFFALALSAAAACRAAEPAGPPLPPQPAIHPAGIPADAVLVSPCIATMGEHWVNPKDAPLGPIYGVWQGKPVFTEIMVSEGFPVPHYDVHAYYVTPAVQATICPSGIPDPAMKAMNQP